jgi:membrane protein DedA with SNARE-associated domain
MLAYFIALAQQIITAVGPLGVGAIAFIPEIIPPIPSALVPMTAGFVFLADAPLSAASFWKLFLFVGLPVAGGLTLGAVIIYYIVYWGGKPLVVRFGKYLGVSWHDIEKIQEYMRHHSLDDALLFLGRILPLMPSVVVNVFCGLVRWPLPSYLLYTVLGTVVRAMIMGFIGWEFATAYVRYASLFEQLQGVIFVLILAAALAFFHHRRKSFREDGHAAPREVVQ